MCRRKVPMKALQKAQPMAPMKAALTAHSMVRPANGSALGSADGSEDGSGLDSADGSKLGSDEGWELCWLEGWALGLPERSARLVRLTVPRMVPAMVVHWVQRAAGPMAPHFWFRRGLGRWLRWRVHVQLELPLRFLFLDGTVYLCHRWLLDLLVFDKSVCPLSSVVA